ncbi:MAG: ABC transporter ATP-binding protein [Lachnospiraceae bacterium]|nr:ABC transporter ATP-binding protein [Lachnospiraceae bacterium]
MNKEVICVNHVYKEYRLGTIGGGTLRGDLQSLAARIRGKEDPNSKIGQKNVSSGKFLALNDVSFCVNKGEKVGIIGHNGAGKSTLLKLLSRVTAPSQGTMGFNGRVASMLEVGTGFHPELTGRENVYMNGAILGMNRKEISAKFDEIVSFAEMEKFIDTPVKRYSSGMYVKLAFAVAAHLDSEILVMDEVLAVGDMKFQQKCLGKMGNVADEEGRTILYVSHNMNTIRQLCDRCIVLDHGKLIFDGDVEKAIELYSDMGNHTLLPKVNLSNQTRVSNTLGRDVKMMQFNFTGDEKCEIQMKNMLPFELVLDSKTERKDVCFRCMIYYSDDTPVCMAGSSRGEIVLQAGENRIQGEIDTGILAPGTYHMKLAAYCVNDYGTEEHLDVLDKAVYFTVDDSKIINNMQWLHQYWGHAAVKMKISNVI